MEPYVTQGQDKENFKSHKKGSNYKKLAGSKTDCGRDLNIAVWRWQSCMF